MKGLFQYNWEVRHAWFKWCLSQPQEELVKKRSGGMGSIKKNLFHIVDVEVSWIYAILEKPDIQHDYSHYQTIQQIARFSDLHRSEIESVIFNYSSAFEHLPVKAAWSDEVCTQGDI